MKNIIKTIFVIITLILLSLPVIFFNSKQTISEKENRTLAERPKFIKDEHINYSLFSEYDSFFQDHLGFRNQLIQLNSKNPLKIQATTNQKALEGKNGWYFTIDPKEGNNLLDFYKRNLMDSVQIEQFTSRISSAVQLCNEHNIKFLFLICPNKHTIYEEFYPYERPEGITRADQLIQILETMNLPYIFPREYLISKKADYDYPLYIETDTHWNSEGAYLTSILVRDKLKEFFPDTVFPEIEYSATVSESYTAGDILPLLNLTNIKSTQIQLTPKEHTTEDFYSYIKYDGPSGSKGIHTQGTDKQLPRAIIFRDSFYVALEPFTSPFFSEAEYQWKNYSSSDQDYILEFKPDIVIFEVVERNFPIIIK